MNCNRRYRFITVLLALMSLLFSQLALASYVCPAGDSRAAVAQAVAKTGMPCAESMGMLMDEAQPHLCRAHCQADQTVQQKAEALQIPVLASLPGWGADGLRPHRLDARAGVSVQPPILRRTTAPPLAIRHCCFRL